MQITTRKTISMMTGEILEHQYYSYSGTVAYCKGDSSKAEQQRADNIQQQDLAIQQQQLNAQLAQLQGVNAAVDPIISSIISGQTPTVLAPLESSLTASYMNLLPATYRAGMAQINNNLVARGLTGGTNAGGGGVAGNFGALTAALAAQQQQGATDTAQALNAQKLQLLGNSLNAKMGLASQYGQNVGTFGSGVTGALNAGVQAAGNADAAATSWMGPVFGALGGTSFGKGGFSICYVAAEVYGSWSDPRAQFVRSRLLEKAQTDLTFKGIVVVYAATGKLLASLVRHSSTVRRFATRVLDAFVSQEIDNVLNELVHSS